MFGIGKLTQWALPERKAMSSCASGVSRQRSGWTRAMRCRTVQSSVARSAATYR
jgi:hypothetical protein